MSAPLVPDLGQARAYLTALTGEDDPTVTFQTFDDDEKRKSRKLARVLHGRLGDHADTLASLNNLGAGVFVMVNAGDGKGRTTKNVVGIRAFYMDHDKPKTRPYHKPATFTVHTSPGKEHGYFVLGRAHVDPLPIFSKVQKALATYYGADLSVTDLCRVMRLPGYHHMKKKPVLVTFEPGSGHRFDLIDISMLVPTPEEKPAPAKAPPHPKPTTGSRREKLVAIVRAKAEARSWTEGDRHASAKATAVHARKLGLEAGDIVLIVSDLLVAAGKTEGEAEELVEWAMREVAPDPKEAERPTTTDPDVDVDVDVDVDEDGDDEAEEPRPAADVRFPDAPAREAFYGLAGEFVRIVAPHTEADETALLAHLIIYFGNAVGRGPFFRVGATRHTVAENVAFVGETGDARKGTAEHEARRPFLLANDPWEKRITTGLSSGEGLLWAVRDAIEKREPIREKGRVTGYENVIADEGVQDKRLCVLEAEMGKTCKVMDREGNTLSATIREAWDAREVLRTLTKNTPAVATGAHISILGHVTRDELLRHLDRTETANGFGNRFLWIAVKRSKFLPDGGSLRDADLAPFVQKLCDALARARKVQEMTRDEEARAVWHGVYQPLETGRAGLFGAVTGRAAPHVLRLSMIYALTDGSAIIRVPHLTAALALWAYCEDSARYVFGDATGDPEADAIYNALRDAPGRRLRREAIRDLFSRHVPAQRIESALSLLARLGKAHMETEKTKGRPAEWWLCGAARRAESAESAESATRSADPADSGDFPRMEARR